MGATVLGGNEWDEMSLGCLKRVKDFEVAKAAVLHTLIKIVTTTTKVQNFGAMARDAVCSRAKETMITV